MSGDGLQGSEMFHNALVERTRRLRFDGGGLSCNYPSTVPRYLPRNTRVFLTALPELYVQHIAIAAAQERHAQT